MKPKYSKSLVLVWEVAAVEARHLKASMIEPVHLFLGLCRVVDLNLPEMISKDSPDRDRVLEELLRETGKLRTIFSVVGMDARMLRRRLRQAVATERFSMAESGIIHRSTAAKEVFSKAEEFAQPGGTRVYPIHLLCASLSLKDEARDKIFDELRVDAMAMQELVRHELLLRPKKPAPIKPNSRAKWN